MLKQLITKTNRFVGKIEISVMMSDLQNFSEYFFSNCSSINFIEANLKTRNLIKSLCEKKKHYKP